LASFEKDYTGMQGNKA